MAALSLLAALAGLVLPALAEASRNVYVTGFGSDNVSTFAVGATGSIAPVAGSPFAAGTTPRGVAAAPDGKHLYVSNFFSNDVSAFAVAADGSLSPVAGSPFAAGSGAGGVAAAPDGKHLYVSNIFSNDVSAYAVAADGSLAPVAGSPFAAGSGAGGVAAAPDGKHLYVSNSGSSNISAYAIAADGSLSPVAGSPFAAGTGAVGVAAAPDGKHLYVSNFNSANVSAYAVAADGSLAPVTGSPFAAGTGPAGVAAAPDGKHLYVSNAISSDISAYAVAADGSLAPVTGSPFAAGVVSPTVLSTAISPNQPPLASFTSGSPAVAGEPVAFDASASTDPDGTVARYAWDFGDGTTLPDGGPTPTHTYATAGSYSVSVTLTDDEGCSTTIVYTGQTASCNGSGVAAKTQNVAVADPPPVITDLRVTPSSFAATNETTPPERARGARIELTLSEDAKVRFKIRQDPARPTGGPPPRSPRSFSRALSEGENSVPFTGKLGEAALKPRRYTVIARAIDSAGQRSERVSAGFRITG